MLTFQRIYNDNVICRLTFFLIIVTGLGCRKEFLEKKPQTNLTIPSTLNDFQQLLDNDFMMEAPGLGEISSDDYSLTTEIWKALPVVERNAHVWNTEVFDGTNDVSDWNNPYRQVLYANVTLEGLEKVSKDQNAALWNNLYGSALFVRSFAFYNLSQIFCPPYDNQAGSNSYGLPLKLTSDISSEEQRSTLAETYEQILNDLKKAKGLLPDSVSSIYKNRPSKPAADALLARVYLSMRDYDNAGRYADSFLRSYNKLMNYNLLPQTGNRPFSIANVETVYQMRLDFNSTILLYIYFDPLYAVNAAVYNSYASEDLRRSLFFKANKTVKSSYTGNTSRFSGLATDEQLLIRAECNVRKGLIGEGLADLDSLLVNRYLPNKYVPNSGLSKDAALDMILNERRKELIFRGLRWTDLRRLNLENNNISPQRILDKIYQLPSRDLRWVLPLPPQVVNLSALTQNPR